MTTGLMQTLCGGGHSLVVAKDGEVRTYDGPGVSDLLRLVAEGGETLRGAAVADKVVGKAAAALMVAGGVSSLDAAVVSSPAIALLRRYGIPVRCQRVTPYIVNRKGTGMCPLELRCMDCATAEECIARIHAFLDSKR